MIHMENSHLISEDKSNTNHGQGDHQQRTNRKRPQPGNPLQTGISTFIKEEKLGDPVLSDHGVSQEKLFASLPKRYTIYPPLLLLSFNVFTAPTAWKEIFASLNDVQRQKLYVSIVSSFANYGVTHLAQNAPIESVDHAGFENRMRSPSGLIPLLGDFGNTESTSQSKNASCLTSNPTRWDLDNTLWVKTVQNNGIVQTWAPLYTMFSKGNITEKARILGLGSRFDGLSDPHLTPEKVEDISTVDLYAGIGYFVFSYLKRGVKRVWCWEINGWSIAGLQRGCVENGWGCKAVPVHPDGMPQGGFQQLAAELDDSHQVVVFHGDNAQAPEILATLKPMMEERGQWASIRHVNMGLLPTSHPTWKAAVEILDCTYGGWAHVHENVDVNAVEAKRDRILEYFRTTEPSTRPSASSRSVKCEHIELVKTYAPGVMHCVFDIKVNFQVK